MQLLYTSELNFNYASQVTWKYLVRRVNDRPLELPKKQPRSFGQQLQEYRSQYLPIRPQPTTSTLNRFQRPILTPP